MDSQSLFDDKQESDKRNQNRLNRTLKVSQ